MPCRRSVVLIETLWNVKMVKEIFEKYSTGEVLIETLWNVKKETATLCSQVQAVLIETLWNVKKSARLQDEKE